MQRSRGSHLEVPAWAEGRLQQAGGAVKHFINTSVVYSSSNTVMTLYGGTDYDLANSPIIEPYFSGIDHLLSH